MWSIDRIIFALIACFAVLGGLDCILGNRFGLGKRFEEGLTTVGQLVLTIVGIFIISLVLAKMLTPIVVPFYEIIGADPAMFAGTFFACDMGGAPMAKEMAKSSQAASLGGILTGAMLGATISFTLPVTMGMLGEEKDRVCASKGMLCGILTIPIGILAGGIAAGFSFSMLLPNLLPVVGTSVLIALGLWKAEKLLFKLFRGLGKLIVAATVVGIVAAGVEPLTGFTLIDGLGSLDEGF